MKGYVKPEIHEISDMMETVGLLSGEDVPNDSVTLVWTNHDGGTHSDMWIGIRRGSTSISGGELQITLVAPGRDIVSEGHTSMFTMSRSGNTLKFYFSFQGSQLDYGFNVGDMVFSPGPFDSSTPKEAWKGAPGSVGNGVESGSFGQPTETVDARAVKNPSVPDIGIGAHDIFTGTGNAQLAWSIDKFKLW